MYWAPPGWTFHWLFSQPTFSTKDTLICSHLVIGEKVVQLEGCTHSPSNLRSLVTCCQGILFRQSSCKLLETRREQADTLGFDCVTLQTTGMRTLTASRMQIFFSSSSFCVSLSWRPFSFFFNSAIFSFLCSSLTSESAEPVTSACH